MSKSILFDRGFDLLRRFCEQNELVVPEVRVTPSKEWRFGVCAYYRPTYIAICLQRCAPVGTSGASWSYPGYLIDRTPYGVLQHELGHHTDVTQSTRKGPYFGDYSKRVRELSGEAKITSYAPNDAEWFAEMFRVFVTNPDLLQAVRPRTYKLLRVDFRPVESRPWQEVLAFAPGRTRSMAAVRVLEQA